MELRHLRNFLEVAKLENISRAAENLNLSQPPLSKQMQQLEEEMEVDLFKRTGKSLALTEAGRFFHSEIEKLLDDLGTIIAETKVVAGTSSGEIKVGYAPSLTVKILPHALEVFKKASPKFKVSLLDLGTNEILNGLKNGVIDVGLLVYPGKKSLHGLEYKQLQELGAVVLLPINHPLANRKKIKIDELDSDETLTLTRKDYPEYRVWLAKLFGSARKKPNVVEEHDSINSLMAAVQAGRGIAYGGIGIKDLAGSRLRVVELAEPAQPIKTGVVWKSNANNPATEVFVEAVLSGLVAD